MLERASVAPGADAVGLIEWDRLAAALKLDGEIPEDIWRRVQAAVVADGGGDQRGRIARAAHASVLAAQIEERGVPLQDLVEAMLELTSAGG